MKRGNKALAHKVLWRSVVYIKTKLRVNALLIIKNILLDKRVWYNITKRKLKKRVLLIPKLLSVRHQFSKTLKYIFNNFKFKEGKGVRRKPLHKKIAYILLDEFLRGTKRNRIMKEQMSLFLKENVNFLYKEEFKAKYTHKVNTLKRVSLFRKKYKSLTRRDKQHIRYNNKVIKRDQPASPIDVPTYYANRYKWNLMLRNKIKSKWRF